MSEWLNKIFGRGGSGEKPPSDIGDVIEVVTPHTHCERCGKAIALGKRFCSATCKRGEGKGPGSSIFWIILLIMLMLLLWR